MEPPRDYIEEKGIHKPRRVSATRKRHYIDENDGMGMGMGEPKGGSELDLTCGNQVKWTSVCLKKTIS